MTTAPTFEVHEGDALSFLRKRVTSASIDLICTDPPYESLEKHRKSGTTTRLKVSKSSSNVWFPVIPNAAFKDYFIEFMRVLKPGRHLYLFCDPETSYYVVPVALEAGFKWGNCLIWDKQTIGMGYHYRRTYENILFLVRPGGEKRKLADLGTSDIIRHKRLKGDNYYPTEKPCGVINVLVQQSTLPGELVLDPFCGSGSTGEAALMNGCRFLGCDVTPEAVRRTRERLQGLSASTSTPTFEKDKARELARAAAPKGMQPVFKSSGARTTDPETSWSAAQLAKVNAGTNREAALRALCAAGSGGLTDFQLADVTGVQQTSIGKRRGELVEMGFVEEVPGLTRPSPTNSPAIVWRATAKAMTTA